LAAVAAVQRKGKGKRIVCQGCLQTVEEIDPASIGRLLGFDQPEDANPRAFECKQCEAIIFETELVNGEFIPPQFRSPRL